MPGDTGAERRRLRLDGGEPRSLKNLAPVPDIIFRVASVPGSLLVMSCVGTVMSWVGVMHDVMRPNPPIAGDVMHNSAGMMSCPQRG